MRGKLIRFFLALLILAVVGLAESAAPPILINGDFELGDKSGWFGYGCRMELVTDDVYRGRYACRAWLDQEWGGGNRARFNAPAGKYLVTMWVKTSPGLANKCLVGADKFGGTKVSVPVKTAGQWVEMSFEIKLRNTSGEISWGPKTQGGWILLDEVKIEPLAN